MTRDAAGRATAVRVYRRQLRNLVGAALALQPGHRPRDVAHILARQACQALGARQAVASVIGAGDGPGAPLRAIAGDARTLSGDHLRLLEQAEGGTRGLQTLVDPATETVTAAAASIDDRAGRPVGALMVADLDRGPFGEDDIAVLVGLAHIAALTLDNGSLQEPFRLGESPGPPTVVRLPSDAARELVDLVTVILGHASILETRLPEGDDHRVDVAGIVTAAQRAARV
jgi:GAF domain-containing protein